MTPTADADTAGIVATLLRLAHITTVVAVVLLAAGFTAAVALAATATG